MRVYESWKPLRNFLSKVGLHDALGVIRYYSVRKTFNERHQVPNDIELHGWVDRQDSFLPWELETLAREALYVCDQNSVSRNTLKTSKGITSAINKMKAVDTCISTQYISQKNILHEVTVRLAHRQFKYQTDSPNWNSIVRYGEMYAYERLSKLVEDNLGVSAKKIYTIGVGTLGLYTEQYGITHPLQRLDIPGVTPDDYQKFMDLFSCSLEDMKKKLSAERSYDDAFFYSYHSLYEFPIVLTTLNDLPTFVCPIPTLLYWRITSGLYYKLYKIKGFDNAFGDAYEDYVGRMLKKTLDKTNSSIYAGEVNTANSPNRFDWIIDKPKDVLFIECKVKRPSLSAKVSLSDDELSKQLDILADAVVQAYKSYIAYRDGLYNNPVYKFDPGKGPFITVVTLEKWHLMSKQNKMLDSIVREKLSSSKINEAIISECPYVAMSITDLEEAAYLAKTLSIMEIMKQYIDEDRDNVGCEFSVYLHNRLGDKLKGYDYIFSDGHTDLFTVPPIR